MNFRERFRDKISTVSKHGELNVDSSRAVNSGGKPSLQASAGHILNSERLVLPAELVHNALGGNSLTDLRSPAREVKFTATAQSLRGRKSDFTPYTLNDYRNIRIDKYYELGGLGAAYVGSQDWKDKRQNLAKRTKYARQVDLANTKRVPLSHLGTSKGGSEPRRSGQGFVDIKRPPLELRHKAEARALLEPFKGFLRDDLYGR